MRRTLAAGHTRSICASYGEPVDDYVENAVLERLSQPDANLLITERGVDVGELQDRRAGFVAKLDQLVELLDGGTLDGPKAWEKAAAPPTAPPA